MSPTAEILFAIGSLLLPGMATDFPRRHSFLPRLTRLLLFGPLGTRLALQLNEADNS